MRGKSLSIIVWIITGIWFLAAIPNAWATCGSANCFLVTGTQEGVTVPGQMTLDISYRYIPMDDFHRGSSNTNEAVTPKVDFENGIIIPDHHREVRTINELLQIDVGYGVTDRLTVQLSIPLINDRTHEHFDEVGTPEEFFTREDGTSGIGDIRLIAKYAPVVLTRHLAVVGLGVKLASGEYKLLDSQGDINEPTIMPGTGSYDVLFSLFYDYQVIPHELDTFLSWSYQLATENDLDYEFGDQTLLNAGLNYLLTEKISVSGQINVRIAERDKFIGQNVPSTGGTWINLTPGVRIQAADRLSLYTHVQLPVFQDVNEVNLVARYGLLIGASYAF